jgi:sporulation protein YlmC with PRC-barrel domain
MKALFISLVALAAVTTAYAQERGGQSSATPPSPPVAGGTVLGVEVREVALIAEGYRVSKLLNQPVYNDKNEKIGTVEDFIVKPDGTLSYAIIDVGGFLKMGAHRVAIPVSQLSQVKPRIVLPGATKDALKQMPEFTYAKDAS